MAKKATKRWVNRQLDDLQSTVDASLLAVEPIITEHLDGRIKTLESDADRWRGFPAPSELWKRLFELERWRKEVDEDEPYEPSGVARAAKEFDDKSRAWATKLDEARTEQAEWKRRVEGLATVLRAVRSQAARGKESATIAAYDAIRDLVDDALNTGGV